MAGKGLKLCCRKNLVLLANAVKNYRSASLLARKQGLLAVRSHGSCRGGGERCRFRAGQAKGSKGQGQGWPEPQVLCPEDVYSWRDRGEEVTY